MKSSLARHILRDAVRIRPRIPWIWNAIKYKYHTSFGRPPGDLYGPISCGIFITNKCNLKCDFCCYGVPENQLEVAVIDMPAFMKLLDHPLLKNVLRVSFGGGEPMMHKSFFDFVSYARSKRKLTGIFTNGLYLKKYADDVLHSDLSNVLVSLYDSHMDTQVKLVADLIQKRSRGSGGPFIGFNRVVNAHSYQGMEDTIKLAMETGVDGVLFQNSYAAGSVKSSDIIFDDDVEYLQFITMLKKKYRKIDVQYPSPVQRVVKSRVCLQPFQAALVDAKGNLGPCCYMPPAKKYGNILQDPNAWNNDLFKRLRESLLGGEEKLFTECEKCSILGENLY